jgi:hypothetical protein
MLVIGTPLDRRFSDELARQAFASEHSENLLGSSSLIDIDKIRSILAPLG